MTNPLDSISDGRMRHWRAGLAAILLAAALAGCSVKRMAVNQLGDALASGGSGYASDDDLELVRGAVPFSLKLIESLLAESPRHRGLLRAASSGFTQYAFAFVQQEADEAEEQSLEAAEAGRARARRLYRRARDYGMRGLALRHPNIAEALLSDPKAAVRACVRSDVALMYWTAASWGALISLSKNSPELIAQQPAVEALIDRALELEPDFEEGAIHGFLISYEGSRPGGKGTAESRARAHFQRAVQLSLGRQAGPYVSLAEAVSLQKQDAAEFKKLLEAALAVDPDATPRHRLANLVMQRRARWLMKRMDDLFVPDKPISDSP